MHLRIILHPVLLRLKNYIELEFPYATCSRWSNEIPKHLRSRLNCETGRRSVTTSSTCYRSRSDCNGIAQRESENLEAEVLFGRFVWRVRESRE
ncbi:hypothetical protein GCK32_014014 [Trichostrongylus colubriformis]|uniref:Uncharacterized protein n=1 Tax=Trichostrongylus colubriformis TaxID=6319 RepID=A0AAN8F258_TRICO